MMIRHLQGKKNPRRAEVRMFPVRKGRENREIFFSKWIKPTAPEEKNRKRNGIGPAPEEKEEGGGGRPRPATRRGRGSRGE